MRITTDEIWWNEGENSLFFLKWIGSVALKDVVIGSGGAMLMRFVQALHFAKRCKAGPAVWLHFLRAIPCYYSCYTYTAYTCIWEPLWRMLMDIDSWPFADFSGTYPTKPDFCRDLNLLDFFWSTWPTCWWSEFRTTGMLFSWSDTIAMWPSFFMYWLTSINCLQVLTVGCHRPRPFVWNLQLWHWHLQVALLGSDPKHHNWPEASLPFSKKCLAIVNSFSLQVYPVNLVFFFSPPTSVCFRML